MFTKHRSRILVFAAVTLVCLFTVLRMFLYPVPMMPYDPPPPGGWPASVFGA